MTKKQLGKVVDDLVLDVAARNDFTHDSQLDVARALFAKAVTDLKASILTSARRIAPSGGPMIGPDGKVHGPA